MQHLSVDLGAFDLPHQDLGTLFTGGAEPQTARIVIALLLLAIVGLFITRGGGGWRGNSANLFAGVAVGIGVIAGWWLTAGPWGQEWLEAAEWLDERPQGVAAQSFTFVNPMGELLTFASQAGNTLFLTFGIVAVVGMIVGSFVYALFSGNFRIEWFASLTDFSRHIVGAALMGIGGVLAMGCTLGQGISGIATLAFGSFVALFAIILGSATLMKAEYYKMLYEEASWADALLSGWADLRLLPASMRKLEAL